MRKAAIFLTLLGVTTACQEEKPKVSYANEKVRVIDVEIERLTKEERQLRNRANNKEREALTYMRADWATYTRMMKEIESDQDAADAALRQIKELEARKKNL